MEKCIGCQFYDRNDDHVEDKGVRWGKCRRGVPIVHPVSAKAYMVEGIWPHVRDDDWCGEWTAVKRKGESVSTDPRNLLVPAPGPAVRPTGRPGSLMTPVTAATDIEEPAPSVRFGSD